MVPAGLSSLTLCMTIVGSLLCRYTIRDVGFVHIGEPLIEQSGDVVRRASDGAELPLRGANAMGGPHRRALAQSLLDSMAVVVLMRGESSPRVDAAVDGARADLRAMDDAGRLARPLDGPVAITELDAAADPAAAFALEWAPGDPPAAAVLYGRGRLAGPILRGGSLDRASLLDQLSLVAESCECDRPRDWLHARHLPLPWDSDLRLRAAERLGFDPHSPRVRAEMDRILERGPRGTAAPSHDPIEPDPLMGYDEVIVQSQASPAAQLQREDSIRKVGFSRGLFWFIIALALVTLAGVALSRIDSSAA